MTLVKTKFPMWPNMSDFFDDNWFRERFEQDSWLPAVNVVENEQNYEIEVAAPGFNKEDFDVSVENGVLTVKCVSEKQTEEKDKNYTRKEFSSQSFSRSFTLPENVIKDQVNGEYKDGVLRLTIKKSEESDIPKTQVEIK